MDVGGIQSISLIVGGTNDSYLEGAAAMRRSISAGWLEQNWFIETITIIRPNDPETNQTIRHVYIIQNACHLT